jgi:tRNA threonylcarbamoyladenosine biosynthesis protein TsaB
MADAPRAFRCIAIETATSRGSVAVLDGDTFFVAELDAARDSSRRVYGALREVLDRAGLQLGSLDCVAFGNGPGSFTGVRVAVAAAQALAFAADLPACPVSSLAAMAAQAGRTHGAEPIAACLDARMGQVYFGLYRFDPTGLAIPVQPDRLAEPDSELFPDGGEPAMAVGPGWRVYPELLATNAAMIAGVDDSIWPTAAGIAVEARERFRQGKVVPSHEALPNYVRNKVTG